jgi:hypothetical protein
VCERAGHTAPSRHITDDPRAMPLPSQRAPTTLPAHHPRPPRRRPDVFSLMGIYPGFTSSVPATPGFDGERLADRCNASKAWVQRGVWACRIGALHR